MALAVFGGRATEPLVEDVGKVLAGLKAAIESNLSDRPRWVTPEKFSGLFKTAMRQILDGTQIGNLLAIMGKTAAPEPALAGHAPDTPRLIDPVREGRKEQLHRPPGRGEAGLERDVLGFEQLEQFNQQRIQADFEASFSR